MAEWGRAAKIRLRFDKVVRKLRATLHAALVNKIPKGHSVVLTITAPIRRPSATAASLEDLFCKDLPDAELRRTINGNRVRVRRMTGVAKRMPKVVVLVHNPESNPGLILAIAESRLRKRN